MLFRQVGVLVFIETVYTDGHYCMYEVRKKSCY